MTAIAPLELPKSWNQAPLKYVAEINSEKLDDDTDPDYRFRYIDIASITEDGGMGELEELRFEDAPSRARRVVRAGDIVVSTVRTYLRAIARVPESDQPLICSTGFATLRAQDIDPRYLYWWTRSAPFIEEVVGRSVGVSYPAVNPADVGRIMTPVPPLSEQRAISDFLDRETTRIDTLAKDKNDLRSLTRARLKSLVHSLTAGREGDSDSGGMAPLGRAIRFLQTGGTPPTSRTEYYEGGSVDWLGPSSIGDALALLPPEKRLAAEAIEAGHAPLFPGDTTLLVAIGATAGRVGHLGQPASANQQITCLGTNQRMLPRFLSWQLWSRAEELRSLAPRTTLPIMSNDFLRSLRVYCPPLGEQVQALRHIEEEARRSTQLDALIHRQIQLLDRHRQALISKATAGWEGVRSTND